MGGGSTAALSQMIEKGMLGRKTGKGFFLYDGKSKAKPNNPEESSSLTPTTVVGYCSLLRAALSARSSFTFCPDSLVVFLLRARASSFCASLFLRAQATEILKAARAGRQKLDLSIEEIQQRMATRLINEAAFCLQDGVIENPVDGR